MSQEQQITRSQKYKASKYNLIRGAGGTDLLVLNVIETLLVLKVTEHAMLLGINNRAQKLTPTSIAIKNIAK